MKGAKMRRFQIVVAAITINFIGLGLLIENVHAIEVSNVQAGSWTVINSPYVVTGDILIPDGMILTIDRGVVVKFAGNFIIRVEGTLKSIGKQGDRIVFTSIYDNEFGTLSEISRVLPTTKDWKGIEFAASSGSTSQLDYCILRYSEQAIIADKANPSVTNTIIADCSSENININGEVINIQNGVELDYKISIQEKVSTLPAATVIEEAATTSEGQQEDESVLSGEEFSFGEITVVSAARTEQRISEAPAAITVIDEQDIKFSGAVTIPDLLRMVPGLDIMQITTSDLVINARGYNKEMSNKMLVLIDGRSVYWDFYGIVLWDTFPIVLEDIKRIEIIRGPGSALYGANAFSGVINIITKSPEETRGTSVSVSGGSYDTYLASVIHSGGTEKLSYKMTLGLDQSNHWQDHSEISRNLKRTMGVIQYKPSEKTKLILESGIDKGQGETLSGIGRMNRKQNMGHVRLNYKHSNFSTQIFWIRSHGDAIQVPGFNPFYFLSNTYDIESQYLFNILKYNSVIMGGNYRVQLAESDLIDKDHQQELYSAYVQDEFRPHNSIAITVGLRYDKHPLVEEQITPRANIILLPHHNHTFRFSYGTAFRNPSFIESYLHEDSDISAMISSLLPSNTVMVKARGNLELSPEKITSFEIGYHTLFTSRLRLKVDFFYNELYDFISFKTVGYQDVSPIIGYPPGSVVVPSLKSYTNAGRSKAIGGEIGFEFLATRWLKGFINYSYQDLTWEEDDPETPENEKGLRVKSSPKNKVNCGLRFNFRNGFSANFLAHYVDATEKTETWAYGKVDSYTLVNARIGYRFYNNRLEMAVTVFNLLNEKHYEYPGNDKQGNPIGGHEIGSRIMGAFLSYNF